MRANRGSDAMAGVYGQSLGTKFGAQDAPFIATRSLQNGVIAVTELRVDYPLGRLSDPIPPTDSYMLCLILRDIPDRAYWENGRQVSKNTVRVGEVTFHDLLREPLAMIDKPLHSLLMYVPCTAFHELAEQLNVPRISGLRYDPGAPVVDDVIKHIGFSLLPALQAPERVNRLFADHVMLALAGHCAQTYGGMQTISGPPKGGLSPWQANRAKEMLASDLTGATPLHEIAGTCGLSVSHFSRAFHKSTGLAPHAWLLQARVESAKAMLRGGDASLSTIARACGFADQSHFTRVFTRRVGSSPGAWRKSVLG
jgi:AraC family transcriptional regulator